MLMSVPFGRSISTSPLGVELQGSQHQHDVCPSLMLRSGGKHHRSGRDQPVFRRRDCCAYERVFLVGKKPRLEIGPAAMQNAIAKIEDLIDKTSAMSQESLGVTHQE